MNLSTVPLAPGTTTAPGTGAPAEPTTTPAGRAAVTATDHALLRAATGDYFTWLAHITPAAGCTRPIRLAGELATVEADTGRLLAHTSTGDLPDGVIYKACGNRRHTVCPSCAETYRRDAYELIRTGLSGGKTVPTTIATHPAVFITLTAPSFGPVHTQRHDQAGRTLPCRPRRQPDPCPHGNEQRCHRQHGDNDPQLGIPLCLDCYDHDHQVVWNHHAGELWRRTRIRLDRALHRITTGLGLPPGAVRLRYAKVAEMQRRGVVHFHIIARADGHNPDQPDTILPPPAALTTEQLTQAVHQAAAATRLTTEAHPVGNPAGWHITWGEQVDIRPISLTGDGELTDRAAAGYLAKYATKATETTGHASRRLDETSIDLYADPEGTHPERLIDACWTLGNTTGWRRLRRWAHMLGFGGHFLTKARAYSTTFGHLRQIRVTWARGPNPDPGTGSGGDAQEHDQQTTLLLNWLNFTDTGWKTTGDALLANTAADLARQRRRVAREETYTLNPL